MKKGTLYADKNFNHNGFIREFTRRTDCRYETFDEGILIVFEQYYYRNNSNAGVSIVLRRYGEEYKISIITTAAGVGIMNLSYGADRSLFKEICGIALEFGAIQLPGCAL